MVLYIIPLSCGQVYFLYAERLRITSVPDDFQDSTDFHGKPLRFSRLVHPPGYIFLPLPP